MPPNICILRSQRICIDLSHEGFGPEKAEIRRSENLIPEDYRGCGGFGLLDKNLNINYNTCINKMGFRVMLFVHFRPI